MSERLHATGETRDDAVSRAAAALREGDLVVLPTDTVYGVAADAFSADGTRRIFEAKRRSRRFPLPVLVRSPKQLAGLVTTVPEAAERLMAAYWPGALTIVVPCDPNLMWDLGDNEGTVAVRMPLDDVTLDVIRAVGPLAVTSANLSGQPPAVTAEAAELQLGDAVAVYVDDGARRDLRPSTIVDLTRTEPTILRDGALDGDEVLAVARGELDPVDATGTAPPAEPGDASEEHGGDGDDDDGDGDDGAGTA
jgi:L-threonylcarbamoyladenylate synthase